MDEWELSEAFKKLNQFYDMANGMPYAERRDEAKLFAKLPDSKDEIINANLRTIADYANYYFIKNALRHKLDIDKMVEAGLTGLLRAIEKYDQERARLKDYSFADYAKWWVRKGMNDYLRQSSD